MHSIFLGKGHCIKQSVVFCVLCWKYRESNYMYKFDNIARPRSESIMIFSPTFRRYICNLKISLFLSFADSLSNILLTPCQAFYWLSVKHFGDSLSNILLTLYQAFWQGSLIFKRYLRSKMITFQNVPSEAQFKKLFIS